MFRYDDFPAHPGIAPPHHHHHAADGRVSAVLAPPNLFEVIERAAKYLFPT